MSKPLKAGIVEIRTRNSTEMKYFMTIEKGNIHITEREMPKNDNSFAIQRSTSLEPEVQPALNIFARLRT